MQTIEGADRTSIAFERYGSGPPLVLVHGTAGDHTDWEHLRPHLADRFTVYAMDRRGRGESGDAETYLLDWEFDDVAAMVRHVGEPAFLAGHSFGGLCALEAAVRAPNIRQILLYDPVVPTRSDALVPDSVVDQLDRFILSNDRGAALSLFTRAIAGLSDDELDAIQGTDDWETALRTIHTAAREIRGLNAYRFERDRFFGLDVPAHLVVGDASPGFVREMAEVVAGALPDGRVVELANAGHLPMMLDAERFADEVFGILQAGDAGARPGNVPPAG